jgi:hypothetical protein
MIEDGRPLDKLHHDIGLPVGGLAAVIKLGDMRVMQRIVRRRWR